MMACSVFDPGVSGISSPTAPMTAVSPSSASSPPKLVTVVSAGSIAAVTSHDPLDRDRTSTRL